MLTRKGEISRVPKSRQRAAGNWRTRECRSRLPVGRATHLVVSYQVVSPKVRCSQGILCGWVGYAYMFGNTHVSRIFYMYLNTEEKKTMDLRENNRTATREGLEGGNRREEMI